MEHTSKFQRYQKPGAERTPLSVMAETSSDQGRERKRDGTPHTEQDFWAFIREMASQTHSNGSMVFFLSTEAHKPRRALVAIWNHCLCTGHPSVSVRTERDRDRDRKTVLKRNNGGSLAQALENGSWPKEKGNWCRQTGEGGKKLPIWD